MAVRLFKCDDCGHHMRFSGRYCNACFSEKRLLQRRAFWLPTIAIVIMVILIILLAIALG